jgi:dGTPase
MAVETGRERAIYASDPGRSRGRLHTEPGAARRNVFRRDCDRIIHATAFRRLAHKTQVFVFHEGDHYRTRLTHTLEVTQIARALARALGLDEDLAEALALAHDLGHPPFGHAGERALDACLSLYGGFDHNAQALRVVTALERRYAEFDGLNLTWETREGLVKHNGPLTDATGAPSGRYRERGVPQAIVEQNALQDLELWTYASAEAQAAAIADDIAYDAHDVDDGLRADLFGLDDLLAVPLVGGILMEIRSLYPSLEHARVGHELVRRMIASMIDDVVTESAWRLAAVEPRSAEAIRAADGPCIAFSPEVQAADRAIKEFLFARMYRHERVMSIMAAAETVVRELFGRYTEDPRVLPADWSQLLPGSDGAARARHIADFIAGMTDRYALIEHARLFRKTPELR